MLLKKIAPGFATTCFLGACLCLIPGCASTPDRVAYDHAQAATITVEAAMRLWNAHLAEHHPGVIVETKVKAAYDRYRQADIALLNAGAALLKLDPHSGDVRDKVAAETAWEKAEANLAVATANVFTVLRANGLEVGSRLGSENQTPKLP